MIIHWNILNKKRQKLLPAFQSWTKENAYLAGGTALALQLGHRTSQDFDFYTPNEFDPLRMATLATLPHGTFKITSQKTDNLFGTIHDVQISLFRYSYPLIGPLVKADGLLNLASIEDITAMKIIAVAQRGTRRDFIDLYFLAKQFSLRDMLHLTKEKFKSFNVYNGLRSLVYFQDAEQETLREGVRLLTPVAWREVKGFFQRAVESELRRLS